MRRSNWMALVSGYVVIGLVYALVGNLRPGGGDNIFHHIGSPDAWLYNVVMPTLTWPAGVLAIVLDAVR